MVAPDQRLFAAHTSSGKFKAGQILGRWKLIGISWPKALIEVSAANRPQSPSKYTFQFDVTGYPSQGPTMRPWNAKDNCPLPLDQYPKGTPGSSVAQTFRTDWKNGTALYHPCDRTALPGHPKWLQQHPQWIWSDKKDITFVLEILYAILHSKNYQGIHFA